MACVSALLMGSGRRLCLIEERNSMCFRKEMQIMFNSFLSLGKTYCMYWGGAVSSSGSYYHCDLSDW